jgi:hypothetical protein
MNGARICSSLKEMAQQKQLLSQKDKTKLQKDRKLYFAMISSMK